jgi:hypothetical protein
MFRRTRRIKFPHQRIGEEPVISVRRLVLATVSLLAATAAPASATYYPSGPQTNVNTAQLEGWTQCFSGPYGEAGAPLSGILTACHDPLLLLAGGPNGSSTLTVLAAAPRADVIFETGQSNTPHDANGSGWYFDRNFSWGFAKQGDPINRNDCDVVADRDDPTGPNGDLRLCWHTQSDALDGGFRAGTADFLQPEPSGYTRYIYQAACNANVQFGNLRRNRGKGTARLPVTVPGAGTLAAGGKGLESFQTTASGSGTVAIPVKPKGATRRALNANGKAKVKENITFSASCGTTGNSAGKVKLRKKLG